ncbi:MAG: DivIVA domain-containing protein [Oscillospiraceae bacterium]|nr:DivIVA domain-containing protein [Oscillospiraceae bacterium]
MFTPQQLDEIAFDRVPFKGYDIDSVDEVLGQLIEDYTTLYKENALLKSKMRILVEKLEEYRNGEASLRDAMAGAQKSADQMIRETEVKCAQMLNDANLAAAENAKNASTLIAAESARVEEAKKAAAARIDEIQDQMKTVIQALERIKAANLPTALPKEHAATADAVADEIASNLEAMMGTTVDTAPKAEPNHPQSNTTSRFTNLQFGRNYDPTK